MKRTFISIVRRPVSYTHLEIVVLYVGFHAVFGHEAVILFGAIAGISNHRMGPVSYTHLDVYKRQINLYQALGGGRD